MNRLPAFGLVAVVAVALGGCPADPPILSPMTAPTQAQLYAAEAGYAAYIHTVADYRKLGLCPVAGTKPLVCADRALVRQLALAGKRAKTTLTAVEDFAAAHPGQLAPADLISAAVTAYGTAKAVLAQIPPN